MLVLEMEVGHEPRNMGGWPLKTGKGKELPRHSFQRNLPGSAHQTYVRLLTSRTERQVCILGSQAVEVC